MDEFLRGVGEQFCQIYIDDIIIFSRTEREHEEHLRAVFKRAREFGIKLSPEKCRLAQASVQFLGHVVSQEGVAPDPEKVKALSRMQLPATPKGVRSLLGAINYYRRFVPQMARRTAAISNMLRKGAQIKWTEEARQGALECIKLLGENPILRYPDFERPFIVTSDASAYALGAVLSQEDKRGDGPIAYISRRLTAAEERYSALERELLGVVWAIEQFRPYVYGRAFVVRTDHKPLQWVHGLKESSARICRWKERLMAYDFEVKHTPGTQNAVADWLSRAVRVCAIEEGGAPGPSLRDFFAEWRPEGQDEEEGSSPREDAAQEGGGEPEQLDGIVNDKKRQIRWKTKQTGLRKIDYRKEGRRRIVEIETGAGVTKPQMTEMLKDVLKGGSTYYAYVGNETVWRKLRDLYREERVGAGSTLIRCLRMVQTIMDPKRQWEVTQDYHVGKTNHRGVRETTQALKRRYFWDDMTKTVAEVVHGCDVCCRAKADTRPPVEVQEVTPTAGRPLQQIEIDTYTWQGKSWVTIIDRFSKMTQAYPRETGAGEAVLRALQQWWKVYGVPETITADGGPEFAGQALRKEVNRLGIRWHTTTPGHTQGRGCVERVHGTLADHLRLLQLDQGVEGEEAMGRAIVAYNHSIHTATGYSPVELLFGGAFGRRDEEVTAAGGSRGEVLRAHCSQVQRDRKTARGRLVEEKERRVLRHNVCTRDVAEKVSIGTIVFRRVPTNRRKEVTRFTGPYRVIAILEHNRFKLESVEHPERTRIAHISQLKLPGRRDATGGRSPPLGE